MGPGSATARGHVEFAYVEAVADAPSRPHDSTKPSPQIAFDLFCNCVDLPVTVPDIDSRDRRLTDRCRRLRQPISAVPIARHIHDRHGREVAKFGTSRIRTIAVRLAQLAREARSIPHMPETAAEPPARPGVCHFELIGR